MALTSIDALRAVVVSGSPSPESRSKRLLDHAAERLEDEGVATTRLDLARLPADGLLGRETPPVLQAALAAVARADIVVVGTPVYRASYSGLLKVFFDLLPRGALEGKVGVLVATGGVAGHQMVLDHGLRPLLASLGAITVPTGTYGTDAQFRDGVPAAALRLRIERAVAEALALATTRDPMRFPIEPLQETA